MSKRSNRELMERLGPPENWVLPTDEIVKVMTTAVCLHGLVRVDECQECFVGALLRRQMTLMAERLGCTPEDAQAVSDTLCNEFLERPQGR